MDFGLNPRENAFRKIGYDISFSAQKSVSLAQAILGDDRIVEVFQNVVRATMQLMERDAHVRVTIIVLQGTLRSLLEQVTHQLHPRSG